MALLVAIGILAGAALAYEILLARLFSILLWHHFAYMIISVALLGIGASGTVLAFARGAHTSSSFGVGFTGCAVLFAVSTVGGFALAQRVPFNPLEVTWDVHQQLHLARICLLLTLPFFASGAAIGLAFTQGSERVAAIYRADLLGAGAGALLIVALLYVLPPQDCLRIIGGLGFVAAALTAWDSGARRSAAALAALAVISTAAWPSSWLQLQPSPYKGLSVALTAPGARVLAQRSSPLGLLTVVESPVVSFRYAPGLSLGATSEPPPQLGVFTDAEALTVITRFTGDKSALDYLDQQITALPYHLLKKPRTLILGAGGGADVLSALYYDATHVDAVELNPDLIDLVRRPFSALAGGLYQREGVTVHIAEARSFVEASGQRWDLIQLALLDSFTAAAAGVQALGESPLYTVEALQAYYGHLAPGGLLAITRWLLAPPRDAIKLFATAAVALEQRGVSSPGAQLAMIHSWNTATLLMKNGPFNAADIAAIRAFAEARSFDVAWYPGMVEVEANRFNQGAEPYLYRAALALLGPARERFLNDYRFYITPATDDRPYFFRSFKWALLPELLAQRAQGGLTQVDAGYLVVLATLLQSAVASLVLILLPLAVLRARHRHRKPGTVARWQVVLYFLALGFGFIFIEISFIQRFTLFLGHPLAAIAVVLAAFLVFAGLGSGIAAPLALRRRAVIVIAVAGIIAFAGIYLIGLPVLLPSLVSLPAPLKTAITLVLIAPLGFVMGLPFPLGLERVAAEAPDLVPWAWGINGCASVVGAVLASILAMHIGLTLVICLALALYAVAALTLMTGTPRTRKETLSGSDASRAP
ncbi:SAM-dependent methyltransferase [Microvirga sp. VF16]|uniref:spermine/spermidine synthase domain-containing protein n=1 Tax=Microvirga sp. VF16 TaxID=2807101 RepID=UPI001FEDB306|nr:SAM-dependent methyltransferase [Microvirga sp. VF16]